MTGSDDGPAREGLLRAMARLAATSNGRGVECLAGQLEGDFLAAAGSLAAVESLVLIVTGFPIPVAAPPPPETDGPLGALLVWAALARRGVTAHLVCDEEHVAVLANAGQQVEAIAGLPYAPAVVGVPRAPHGARDRLAEGVRTIAADAAAIVFLERAGPGADGRTRTMRGQVIDDHQAPLHLLLDGFRGVTVAVGDGGNEVGFGRLPLDAVRRAVEPAEIVCTVATQYLVVAGVSNWGAHALAAALSADAEQPDTVLGEGLSRQLLASLVEAGAVDGVSGRREPLIDGLGWDAYWKVPQCINALLVSRQPDAAEPDATEPDTTEPDATEPDTRATERATDENASPRAR